MEPVNFKMPGYNINEYLLVLKPPEDLWQKIIKVKQEFSDRYQVPLSRYLKPHIALVNFLALEMMEEKITHRLHATALGVCPFKVELQDYGSFPSHTIYINVMSRVPIQNLLKQLKGMQSLMRLSKENKPHFMAEPHIGIARKLKPWQFEQGWLEFSQRQFTGKFIADSMLLLKKRAEEKGAFQVLKRLDFLNLPVVTKQAGLFTSFYP